MIGVRFIHSKRHGMSVRRVGDQLVWSCRCGQLDHSHPATVPASLSTLTAHARWVI